MCGIVGVIPGKKLLTSDKNKLEAYLTQAILADSVRGYHSTGIMCLPKDVEDGGLVTYKEALPGYTFVDTRGYRTIVGDLLDYKFLIAHNRWATRGAVNYDNSHPFVHGNIAMVHNGTLRDRSPLPNGSKFTVDSEDVCYNMGTAGVMETLEKIDGAFAIAAIDTEARTLMLTRNSERPLHFATCADMDATLIASEEGMLTWLAERNGIKIKDLYELNEGTLLTFNDDARDYTAVEVSLYVPPKKPEPLPTAQLPRGGFQTSATTNRIFESLGVTLDTTLGFHIYEYNPYTASNGAATGWGKWVGYLVSPEVDRYVEVAISGVSATQEEQRLKAPNMIWEGNASYASIKEVHGFEVPTLNVSPSTVSHTTFTVAMVDEYNKQRVEAYDDVLLGPGGTILTPADWHKLTAGGCAICGKPLTVIQADFIDWEGDEPICPSCAYDMDTERREVV